MKKVKFLFFGIFLLVGFLSLYIFNLFQSPLDPNISSISQFQITEVSEHGHLYQSIQQIRNITNAQSIDVSEINFSNEIFLLSDPQTSFTFIYDGFYFTALPNSQIFYQPKTREFQFFTGEFYWLREYGEQKVDILIRTPGSRDDDQKIVTLSQAGRIKLANSVTQIWNYRGKLKYLMAKQENGLEENQFLVQRGNQQARVFNLLPPTEFISPEEKTVLLKEIGDSVLKFSWKTSPGAQEYIFQLYTSPLKENVIYSRTISTNNVSIDLLRFPNQKDFYWDVVPFDEIRDIEGSPSVMGHIKMKGSLLNREDIMKPPRLVVTSISASGNVVLIQGEADKDSKLYINDELKQIDMDGKFYHTLTYKSIGTKTIIFRLVSPYDIETKIERQITIYEE